MNIFKRIVRAIRKAAGQMVFAGRNWIDWSWLMPNTRYDYKEQVGEGLESSVIMSPVNWIGRRFAEAPFVIFADEEMEREHPVLDLLARPNNFYGGRIWRKAMSLSLVLDGNAYSIKIRNNMGRVIQLWYVPHWMMEPKWPQDGSEYISYYCYTPEGKKYPIDPADVIHIREGLDPENTRLGMSNLKPLFREIFTDDEAANFSASLLRNYGVPGVVMSPAAGAIATPTDTENVKQVFKEKFGGDRRGEPMVMEGPTDIKVLSFSPQAMDLGALRNIPEERVCAMLGVPAAVVGFGTGLQQTKVGATMKEMRESAYEDTIIPMQNLIAEELDVQLLMDFETSTAVHIGFDLSKVRVLQEDENSHAERVRGLVKDRMISVAEGRKELGYEVLPEHEIYLQPFNLIVVPVGETGERETVPAQTPAPEPTNGDDEKRRKILAAQIKFRQQLIQQFNKNWDNATDREQRYLAGELERYGEDVAAAFLEVVEQQGIETFATNHTQVKRLDDQQIVEVVASEVSEKRYMAYGPMYLRVANETFETLDAVVGLAVGLTEQAELQIVAEGGVRRGLVDLTKGLRKNLFKILEEAREEGLGPRQVADRIKDVIPAGPWNDVQTRALVIARTETKYAQNLSSLTYYKGADTVTAIEVVDAQLGDTDSFCMEINGAIVSKEEADILAEEEHPNGTRSFIPVIGRMPDREPLPALTE